MREGSKTVFAQKKSMRTKVDWNNPYPNFPREVFFDVSNACNHKCFFCSNPKITAKANLDKDLAFRLIKECKENGTTDMGFYATGEPFIRGDLADFVGYAKELGVDYVFITTNGSLATPEKAKPVLDAGLDSVKFSVNAGTRESYAKIHGKDEFDKVIKHIKWFHSYRREAGLKYGIYYSMVPTKMTEGEWPLLQKILRPFTDDENLRSCSNQGGNMYENNASETIEKFNILGSLSKDQYTGRCPDPFFRCMITPQGYLSACCVDYQGYLCFADLHETTLKEAWHCAGYVEFRKRHIDNKLKGLVCHNCLYNCNDPSHPVNEKFSAPFKKTTHVEITV